MNKDEFDFVTPAALRLGLFVDLDLGWLSHPFATRRFKISTDQQLAELRGLGLERVRYVPARSDPLPEPVAPDIAAPAVTAAPAEAAQPQAAVAPSMSGEPTAKAELLAAQQASLLACERCFSEATQQYSKTLELAISHPAQAMQISQQVVHGLLNQLQKQDDVAIRLLTEVAGDKMSMHSVNVTVIAVLLGRAMGLAEPALHELGLAALLHDIGKAELSYRLRRPEDDFTTAEQHAYQSHVERGVQMATAMGVGRDALRSIAEHHEMADGSGFPRHLKQQELSIGGRILALVNRYDGLCNPLRASVAMTPHEALAMIFSQQKTRFDGQVLSAFIRMIGVYPPGSVVQLNDERTALVVSVNSSRPLKPRVIVHEPGVLRHDALMLDLELAPNASIRRSMKPASLSASVMDYLQPRQRICYYFDAAANATSLATRA
jgi:putative nucleotidyltransferase with HDIG domain